MKKYFALIISVIVILTCFTACKPKLKGGELVTDLDGKGYAAVTKEGGGIVRDDAGNLVVLVTDKNGKNVKGENGEYQTDTIAIDHALVVGNRIECANYAITIPNGWRDSLSYSDLVLKKDNSEDQIRLMSTNTKKLSEVMEGSSTLIDNMKNQYSDSVYTNKAVSVCNLEGSLISLFIPKTASGVPAYFGYIFFDRGGMVYTCMLSSDKDISEDAINILNSIEFR